MMQIRLCAYCLSPLRAGSQQCPNCAGSTADDPAVEMSEAEYASAARKPCVGCGAPIIALASVCYACNRHQSGPPDEHRKTSVSTALLHDAAAGRFYLIPSGFALHPGPLALQDMDGETCSASAEAIEPFACDADAAKAHLAAAFDTALKQAGGSFRRLKTLEALLAGESAGPAGEEAESAFQRLMETMTGRGEAVPAELQRAIETLNAAAEGATGMPVQLAELFSGDEQAGMVGTAMSRLRDIAGKLDASVLAKNDNPAAWVEVLYRELFAEEVEQTSNRQERRIRSAVSQSIADGLRQRGVTPSADFKRRKME